MNNKTCFLPGYFHWVNLKRKSSFWDYSRSLTNGQLQMTETKLGTTGHTFKKHIHWFLPISVDAIQKDRETEESVKKKKSELE